MPHPLREGNLTRTAFGVLGRRTRFRLTQISSPTQQRVSIRIEDASPPLEHFPPNCSEASRHDDALRSCPHWEHQRIGPLWLGPR
jgi:hypothetical protein